MQSEFNTTPAQEIALAHQFAIRVIKINKQQGYAPSVELRDAAKHALLRQIAMVSSAWGLCTNHRQAAGCRSGWDFQRRRPPNKAAPARVDLIRAEVPLMCEISEAIGRHRRIHCVYHRHHMRTLAKQWRGSDKNHQETVE
ncbi:hypothetical protein [Diaphorobacter caeni]|uniref:hypothetical protein n=1 Tax=Diaphorobacter caeni TaxID=2784387 RepID=UPI00188EDD2A|nr:hypothetical protein [Diaphorobacter caeni]MBF5002740.1 hypothetical protein [Diaphorobacter caeni]